MKTKLSKIIAAGCLSAAALAAGPVNAAVAVVNFDPPDQVLGPSVFIAVPAPQTIVTP